MESTAVLHVPALLASVSHEVSEDFLLPEYLPAIRRIVTVEATPLPENRYLSGGAIEFGGTAAYSVLYLGEDGGVSCVPLTSEYVVSSALGDAEVSDASSVGIDTAAESVTCRVTGPRRLSIRCRMRTNLCALAPRALRDPAQDASGAEEIVQRLYAEAPDTEFFRGELTASASGTLTPGAGARVIRCTGAIHIEQATATADAVTVRGAAILHALCLMPDGGFSVLTARAPIEDTVTVPGAQEGDAARAWGRSAAVTLKSASGEADGEVSWEIEYDLEAEAARAGHCPFTADAYAMGCPAELKYTETEGVRLLRCGCSAVTVSGESGRQSKPAPGERVIDVGAVPSATQLERAGTRLSLRGECAVSVLIAADGDVVSEEFTLPFRCDVPALAESGGELLWRAAVSVCSVTARTEGDRITADLDLDVSLLAMAREPVRAVEAVVPDRASPYPSFDGTLRICYPDPGETVWSVAKRYGAAHEALAEANGLEPGAPCAGPVLIGG